MAGTLFKTARVLDAGVFTSEQPADCTVVSLQVGLGVSGSVPPFSPTYG